MCSPVGFGSHSAGRDLVGCASALEISSGLRGPSPPQAFTPPLGRVHCMVPPIRGMPTEPKVFLAMPDTCGLRPYDRTHLKNGLVPYLSSGGTDDKYRVQCDLGDLRNCYAQVNNNHDDEVVGEVTPV